MEGKDYLEIRWHARAGQGVITAAKMLAEALLESGKYIQAFPEYGPERSGAPMKAFNRISDKPILIHSGVLFPDVVAIVDPTLIGLKDLVEGIKENTVFIINSPDDPDKIRKRMKVNSNALYTVDATKIAIECFGKNIPNTPLLGAVVKVTGLVPLSDISEQLRKTLGKKFNEKTVESNIKALIRGAEEVKGG